MDPVTAAIVAGITAGAVSGVTEVGKQVVIDAYGALKTLIKRRFGGDSAFVEAVDKLEERPESAGWKEEVERQVKETNADEDAEIAAAAEALMEKLQAQPELEQHVQQVIGSSYVAQADRGGTAKVVVGKTKE